MVEDKRRKHKPQTPSGEGLANSPTPSGEDDIISAVRPTPVEESEMILVSKKELAELQAQLEAARQEAGENLNGWQRERADFLNYKKRVERDQTLQTQSIKVELIKRYLDVLDDMDRALQSDNRPHAGKSGQWGSGIELIYRKLQGILEAEGVQQIPAENQMFDPNLHEAISGEDSPTHESGQVIGVVRQGYMIGDRVIRPALVRVAR
ncbi:MAG TPA: nucleotide exchange factor GrpE [Anaerolineaceae bacterium]|jgi:molecular chaperone GrpE|nr:nucleotide exchange factor GrpE [Anaerolineaceae bacterium]